MRLGFVFEFDGPAVDVAAGAGLGIGPPDPSIPLSPDEWIARFAKPLLEQRGTVWRYDLAYGVLGVLLARAGGSPLDELFRVRLLEPLGMADTAFIGAPGLPPAYAVGESGLVRFDGAADSRWAKAPAFPDARAGLVSTATDLLRFAAALLDGGRGVLSTTSVTAMITNHLTSEQRHSPSALAFLDGSGWGYGVQVRTPNQDPDVRRLHYGWGGGLGTLWYSWPQERAAAVLLTQVMPPSRELSAAFITGVDSVLAEP